MLKKILPAALLLITNYASGQHLGGIVNLRHQDENTHYQARYRSDNQFLGRATYDLNKALRGGLETRIQDDGLEIGPYVRIRTVINDHFWLGASFSITQAHTRARLLARGQIGNTYLDLRVRYNDFTYHDWLIGVGRHLNKNLSIGGRVTFSEQNAGLIGTVGFKL